MHALVASHVFNSNIYVSFLEIAPKTDPFDQEKKLQSPYS
jgi:hypothetical protein